MTNELTVITDNTPMVLSSGQVSEQVQLVQQVMKAVMIDGEHYGTIPGCGAKKVLLKAGAEKLALTFKFSPTFKVEIQNFDNGHREYRIITTITHIITGHVLGEGVGSCSTLESKYRYRNGTYKCPICGKETIIKGKAEYGGGFICFAKKGGCGAKFKDNEEAIISQPIGKVENIDIADSYNTVLKMAKKRSLVDAILTATAASDIFTQDLEETMEINKIDVTPAQMEVSKGTIIVDTSTSDWSLIRGKAQQEDPVAHNLIEQEKKIQARLDEILIDLQNVETINDLQHKYNIYKDEVKAMCSKEDYKTFNDAVKTLKKMLGDKVATQDINQ